MLLLHYTGMGGAEAALDWLTREELKVSCHYLVDEDGRITQMVRELERAWHAGQSLWAGETDLNSYSIGIEIHNQGHDFDYRDFPETQMRAVIALCGDILVGTPSRLIACLPIPTSRPAESVTPERNSIGKCSPKPASAFGCPRRRSPTMAALGPGDENPSVLEFQQQLAAFGYGVETTGTYGKGLESVVQAFQRHFRPARIDGIADVSTRETLKRLLERRPDSPAE